MAKAKPTKENPTAEYGNDSISQLQGADRVRLRPGVIFGSDGLDGCEHAVFEILSNSIDEAREGYGDLIILTYLSKSKTSAEVARWTGTAVNSAGTGSWFTVNSMQVASITTTPPETMVLPWG